MNDSSKQQNQCQRPSGSGQLSPEPAEEEARDNKSFALAGLSDAITEGEDDVSTRGRPPEKKREMPSPSTKH